MSQIFHPSTNSVAKVSIVAVLLLAGGAGYALMGVNRSPYVSRAKIPFDQPVPFSHKHHVAGLGIDCRYCHTTVERTAFAGIPETETCMSCHSMIWTNAKILEPVRQSWATGKSLEWTRVHDLPGFVYFNHSIHVNKGMGCSECHGRVDQMPLMYQENTLYMEWCLDCHRNPEAHVRPRDKVFQMDYKHPECLPGLEGGEGKEAEKPKEPCVSQQELGRKLVAEYKIQKLTDCYTCHR
ncbi:MAG: cytochrome c3 family protein [Bryobacterales bacterium]|nr:cytochrome c3 family protein [Bryobacterales bacterium]